MDSTSARPPHARTTSRGPLTSHRVLEGKLAIITGASRGIGLAIAENLASKGCALILNYTSPTSATLCEELGTRLQTEYGITTLVVQADMGNPIGPEHLVNTAKNHFSHPKTGKFQIDIIVNNAGIAKNQTISEVQISNFDSQYKVNVLGPLLLMQAALPYLPHDRSGRIVNLSSVSSTMGFIGQSVYGGTKAALEAMSRTWSRELSARCTVNCVNPGPVKTDMWQRTTAEFKSALKPYVQIAPLQQIRPDVDDADLVADADILGGRPAYTSEIAGIVAMLCTEDSGWCTGQSICANGGMRMSI